MDRDLAVQILERLRDALYDAFSVQQEPQRIEADDSDRIRDVASEGSRFDVRYFCATEDCTQFSHWRNAYPDGERVPTHFDNPSKAKDHQRLGHDVRRVSDLKRI